MKNLMKSIILILSTVFIMTACNQPNRTNENADEKAVADLREERQDMKDDLKETKRDITDKIDEYKNRLEENKDQFSEDSEREFNKIINDLEKQEKELDKQIDKLDKSSEDGWENTKADVNRALSSAKNSVKKAADEVEDFFDGSDS